MPAGFRQSVPLSVPLIWFSGAIVRWNQRKSWVKSEHWQLERRDREEVLILIPPLCSRCSTFPWVPADGGRAAASLWSSHIDGSIDQIWVTDLQLPPAGSGARGAGRNIRAEAAAQRQSDIRAASIRNRLKGFTSKILNLYPRKSRARRIGVADIQTSPNVLKESGNGTISCKIGLFLLLFFMTDKKQMLVFIWRRAEAVNTTG